jgi:uncharacterized protein YjbJ (UPF0337 family)
MGTSLSKILSKIKLNEEKGKLKQKFASLTNDDFMLEEGRKEELNGKREAMYFQTADEFDKIISSL